MNTKCYSVKFPEFSRYSPKCIRTVATDGTIRLLPASQHFGVDNGNENTHWVSEWFIRKVGLPYNPQRCVWFDEHGNMVDDAAAERHQMSRSELVKLYANIEMFVADLTVKEALEYQSAIKGIQTIIHKRINESDDICLDK